MKTDQGRPLSYNYTKISDGFLKIKVRGNENVHFILTTSPSTDDLFIGIMLGGWQNSKSIVCKNSKKEFAETPQIVNGNEYREFYVAWYEGIVTIGKDGETRGFLSFNDPNRMAINYIGMYSGNSVDWDVNRKFKYTKKNLVFSFILFYLSC